MSAAIHLASENKIIGRLLEGRRLIPIGCRVVQPVSWLVDRICGFESRPGKMVGTHIPTPYMPVECRQLFTRRRAPEEDMNEKIEKKRRKARIALTELQLEAVKADDTAAQQQATLAIEELNRSSTS